MINTAFKPDSKQADGDSRNIRVGWPWLYDSVEIHIWQAITDCGVCAVVQQV